MLGGYFIKISGYPLFDLGFGCEIQSTVMAVSRQCAGRGHILECICPVFPKGPCPGGNPHESTLPGMDRADVRRARETLNHFGFENNLDVPSFPIAG